MSGVKGRSGRKPGTKAPRGEPAVDSAWLSMGQAAAQAGVPVSVIRAAILRQDLRSHKHGAPGSNGTVRIHKEDYAKWLASCSTMPGPVRAPAGA